MRLPALPSTKTFAALHYPNYRLWFAGQVVSLFGTWMQSTAQMFLIYELTQSSAFLGYVAFANGVPSWLFMLMGGVVADRIPRRKLMMITQSAMMLLAFTLSALTFSGLVRPWHIIGLAFLLGVTNAFDAPARLALAPELVDRVDLTNAIALNGSMFNIAVIVGPTAGSLVYDAFGPAWCFLLNGLSFIAVIVALSLMKLSAAPPRTKAHGSALQEIIEGVRYVAGERTVLTLMAFVSIFSLFGLSYQTLIPAWAVEVLGGDVRVNGLLTSARGVGALIGALSIASLGRFNYRGRVLSLGSFVFPLMLLIFTFVRALPISMILLAGVGASMVMMMNMANALIQTTAPDTVRGRVNSIYTLTFFGVMPIGAFMIGQIAEHFGAPPALQFGGIILLIVSTGMWLFLPFVRRLE